MIYVIDEWYASKGEALRQLGITKFEFDTFLDCTPDWQGWPPVDLPQQRGPEPYPVMVRGKTYPNVAAAAKALKVSEATVYCGISRGDPDRIGTGTKRPGNKRKVPPFTFGGLTFESKAAASLALGRNKKYVSRILACGSESQKMKLLAQLMKYQAKKELANRRPQR